MTSGLSKEAAELVKQGRTALRPTAADKARVLAALKGQLPPVQPNLTPTAGAGAAGVGLGGKTLLIATGAVVAVVAVVVFASRQPDDLQKVNIAANAATIEPPEFAVPAESNVEPALQATPSPVAASSITASAGNTSATSRGSAADRLGEEVALLTRAQREFHSGNLSTALASVDEHRRKFARGTLGQERIRLRVKILCGLGRTTEAAAEHRKLGRLASAQAASGDVCSVK